MQTGDEVTMQPLCLLVEVGGGRKPLLSAIFDHWAGFLLAASVDVAPGLGVSRLSQVGNEKISKMFNASFAASSFAQNC